MAVPSCKEIKAYLALGLYPKRFHPHGVTWSSSKKFRNYAANFELSDDGDLFLIDEGHKIEIVEDESKKNGLIEEIHSTQHFNVKLTCAKLESNYFWFNMENDVENWISSCDPCKAFKKNYQATCDKVFTDHCYSCNVKQIVNRNKTNDTSASLQPTLDNSTSMSYAKRQRKILQSISTQQTAQINSSNWEHDYIADKLTMRRKLHSFIQESECKLPVEPAFLLVDRQATAQATQETTWKATRFNIDFNLDLIAQQDNMHFLTLLGLEQVVHNLREFSGNPLSVRGSSTATCQKCTECDTDFTPSWFLNSSNQIVCETCHKNILRYKNLDSVQQAFQDYHSRFSAKFIRAKKNISNEKESDVKSTKKSNPRSKTRPTLSRKQKLNICKASAVTRTLLQNKGVKPHNINVNELISHKIQRMMNNPSRRLLREHTNPDRIVQALTKQHSLQEFLESRLKHHKSYLMKQMNIKPKVVKVTPPSRHKPNSFTSTISSSKYQIVLNDLQKKITKQMQSTKQLQKLRQKNEVSKFNHKVLQHHSLTHSSVKPGVNIQIKRPVQPVKLRALSKEKA